MNRIFNITADCKPAFHYMVDISERIQQIKKMVDAGQYFTINRARQYGKTTTLRALAGYLGKEYVVISLDFQLMSHKDFEKETAFVKAFSEAVLRKTEADRDMPPVIREELSELSGLCADPGLARLFEILSHWCGLSEKPIVLIIDEVDSASNNQVFLDFLSQLRGYYIDRDVTPWNIAAKFRVDMSFSADDIAGMLEEYEKDHHTGMDIHAMAHIIYDYTSGYPYLVSWLCKCLDEESAGSAEFPDEESAWTKRGFLEAEKILLNERNTLFESLANKLTEDRDLRNVIYELLFTGRSIPYNPLNKNIETAEMFGFVRNENGSVVIANRIFESVLYNLFMSEEYVDSKIYDEGLREKDL